MSRLFILKAVAGAGLVLFLAGCEGNVKAKEGVPGRDRSRAGHGRGRPGRKQFQSG